MAARVVLAGGTLVDPVAGRVEPRDVVLEGERVAGIEVPGVRVEGAEVIDASEMLVMPGLVDMHVHLREPGFEYKETIATGARAAVTGGFTTVACMANTEPVNDNEAVTRFILERAMVAGGARVFPIGAVSLGLRGEQISEFGEMRRAGIVAVSDDGHSVMNAELMRRALEYARMFDMPVIAHEEDVGLRGDGVMNEGVTSLRLGLSGNPAAAEEIMVARDIALAELTGGRLHVAHVSSAGSVALIRAARARGVAVSAEVTPHHLFLSEEAVADYDTNAKMAPPLRTAQDVAVLRAALADGTIAAIATDHAPHHADEKEVEFSCAANGIVGLETALGLALRLVDEGLLDLPTLIARLTTGPAAVLGLPAGTLAPGVAADVTVVDPGRRWTVDPADCVSKSRNTRVWGGELRGRVVRVYVGGRCVLGESGTRPPLRVAS
jgi:dihydroorotase